MAERLKRTTTEAKSRVEKQPTREWGSGGMKEPFNANGIHRLGNGHKTEANEAGREKKGVQKWHHYHALCWFHLFISGSVYASIETQPVSKALRDINFYGM